MTEKEQEVLTTESQWTQAFIESDMDTLEHLMDDSYLQVQSDGSVKTKAEVLTSFDGGQRYWEYARSDEHVVQIYNDTAVLTGRWQAKGVNHGEAFDYSARFVSVYVKRADGWKMVSDQSTDINILEKQGETNE